MGKGRQKAGETDDDEKRNSNQSKASIATVARRGGCSGDMGSVPSKLLAGTEG